MRVDVQCDTCGEIINGVNPFCKGCRLAGRESTTAPWPKPVCQHRGPSAGNASCGCGAIYRCNLLNKYCADKSLAFPLYEINIVNKDGSTGQVLSKNYQSDSRAVSENFQACSECDFNSNKLKAVADLDSASKN